MLGWGRWLTQSWPLLAKAHVPKYHPYDAIHWNTLKIRKRVAHLEKCKYKIRTLKSVAGRFRLTRFGWERRRARFNGWRKREMTTAKKKQLRTIEYVHRGIDLQRIKNYLPYTQLRVRDFPTWWSPNRWPCRQMLPAHIG